MPDFETTSMVLAILIIGANLTLIWGSTYLPDTNGDPLNYLDTVTTVQSYANDKVTSKLLELDINQYLDTNVIVTGTEPTISSYGLQQANTTFINTGAIVFNAFLGTQNVIFTATNLINITAITGLAIIVITIISAIEGFGLFFIIIRFFSLIRGGGGV